MLDVLWGLGGMVVVLALAVLLSTNRRAIRLRTVGAALALQVTFGVLVLFVPAGQRALNAASRAVQAVIDSSRAGIEFLFGPLLQEGALIFAFQVLPVIVFFAALTAVLYPWGLLQKVVGSSADCSRSCSAPGRRSRSTRPRTSSWSRPRRPWSSVRTSPA